MRGIEFEFVMGVGAGKSADDSTARRRHRPPRLRSAFGVGLLAITAITASAQDAPLRKAPYVPTPQIVVDTMLSLANVTARDFVVDLGSGDGRLVISAAKQYGARGLGVELDATLVAFSRQVAREQQVAHRVSFERGDLFKTDLRPATVLTLYLLPDMLLALRPRLLAMLRPGARIVAHDFDFGEWRPDEHLSIPVPGKPVGPAEQSDIYLWIVPAKLAGAWRGTLGEGPSARRLELAIEQQFQEIAVRASIDGREAEIERAILRGDRVEIALAADGARHVFTGVASGSRLAGSVEANGARASWRATRGQ